LQLVLKARVELIRAAISASVRRILNFQRLISFSSDLSTGLNISK